MRNWIKSILSRLNTGTIKFLRSYVDDEQFIATVHNGQLYIAKGTLIFLCGDCQTVIDKCFSHEMKVGKAGHRGDERMKHPQEPIKLDIASTINAENVYANQKT